MSDKLTRLFIFIDDFSKALNLFSKTDAVDKLLVPNENGLTQNNCQLCLSEILTIIVYFHSSGFKTFKHYYKFLESYHRKEFPNLISYINIIENVKISKFITL